MNQYVKYILSFIILLLVTNGTIASDGQINITGAIISNTCVVDTTSENMTVKMGSVASNQFYHTGAVSAVQPFTIKLVKCGDTASAVSVTFNGNVDVHDNNLLAIDRASASATGMGIAILDFNRQIVPLNTQSTKYNLSPGASSVDLNFYAEYMANGDTVKSGEANATATFVLNYA